MLRLARLPRPPLSLAVALLWYQDVVPGQFGHELVLPSGTAELVIELGPSALTNTTGSVCGPHSTYFHLHRPSIAHAVVGAHFRPGGIRWLLNAHGHRAASPHALYNQVVSLEDIWGREAILLHERLMHVDAPSDRLQLLEQVLQQRLELGVCADRATAAAVRLLRHTRSPRPVTTVAEQLGYSVRRLQQQFHETVGLSPKLFHRLSRFQTVLQTIDGLASVDWSALALAHGYFDQAHLVNDVRTFTSMAPTTLLAHQTLQVGHVRQPAPAPPPRT
jgi:AraC-like DNA-binding protein